MSGAIHRAGIQRIKTGLLASRGGRRRIVSAWFFFLKQTSRLVDTTFILSVRNLPICAIVCFMFFSTCHGIPVGKSCHMCVIFIQGRAVVGGEARGMNERNHGVTDWARANDDELVPH